MTHAPTPTDTGPSWQRSRSGDLLQPATPRPQPPLREVLQGLDVRELDGETIFDQYFDLPPRGAR